MKHPGYPSVLDAIDPPQGLRERILAHIERARRRRARVGLALQAALFFVSGALLVPLAQYAGQELYASGFYEFVSLLFSTDRAAVLASWQEFLYSLVESLPSLAILMLLCASVILVWSLRHALRSSRVAFMSIPTV